MTNTPAEAAREAHRSKSSGKFQSQPHAEARLSLTPVTDQAEHADALDEYVAMHAAVFFEAKRAMNESRLTLAALSLAADGVAPGRVYLEGGEENWWVAQAFNAEGKMLDEGGILDIEDVLKVTDVQFEPRFRSEGVDLAPLAAWSPPDKPAPGPVTVSGRAQARIQKAMAAAVPSDEPDTMANDLLTDLRHWADENDVDLDDVYERSLEHYNEEVADASNRGEK